MPDINGQLTDDEVKRALHHINAKWKSDTCSICAQKNSYSIDRHIAKIPVYPPPPINYLISSEEADRAYPSIVLVCSNCHHMIFFNAVLMGIMEGTPDDKRR